MSGDVAWQGQTARAAHRRERLAATSAKAVEAGVDDVSISDAAPEGEGGSVATKKAPAPTRTASGAGVDVAAYSRNHPPRPRKQGKKR